MSSAPSASASPSSSCLSSPVFDYISAVHSAPPLPAAPQPLTHHVKDRDKNEQAHRTEEILEKFRQQALAELAAERSTTNKRTRVARPVLNDNDPLIKACKKGDVDKLHELLDGLDDEARKDYINSRDKNGSTSIFHTAWPGHLEVARVLLEYGAAVNMQNNRQNTAMHLACERMHHHMIIMMLQFGADITLPNALGQLCYQTAADKNLEYFVRKTFSDIRRGTLGNEQIKLNIPDKPQFFNKSYYSRDYFHTDSFKSAAQQIASPLLRHAVEAPEKPHDELLPLPGQYFQKFYNTNTKNYYVKKKHNNPQASTALIKAPRRIKRVLLPLNVYLRVRRRSDSNIVVSHGKSLLHSRPSKLNYDYFNTLRRLHFLDLDRVQKQYIHYLLATGVKKPQPLDIVLPWQHAHNQQPSTSQHDKHDKHQSHHNHTPSPHIPRSLSRTLSHSLSKSRSRSPLRPSTSSISTLKANHELDFVKQLHSAALNSNETAQSALASPLPHTSTPNLIKPIADVLQSFSLHISSPTLSNNPLANAPSRPATSNSTVVATAAASINTPSSMHDTTVHHASASPSTHAPRSFNDTAALDIEQSLNHQKDPQFSNWVLKSAVHPTTVAPPSASLKKEIETLSSISSPPPPPSNDIQQLLTYHMQPKIIATKTKNWFAENNNSATSTAAGHRRPNSAINLSVLNNNNNNSSSSKSSTTTLIPSIYSSPQTATRFAQLAEEAYDDEKNAIISSLHKQLVTASITSKKSSALYVPKELQRKLHASKSFTSKHRGGAAGTSDESDKSSLHFGIQPSFYTPFQADEYRESFINMVERRKHEINSQQFYSSLPGTAQPHFVRNHSQSSINNHQHNSSNHNTSFSATSPISTIYSNSPSAHATSSHSPSKANNSTSTHSKQQERIKATSLQSAQLQKQLRKRLMDSHHLSIQTNVGAYEYSSTHAHTKPRNTSSPLRHSSSSQSLPPSQPEHSPALRSSASVQVMRIDHPVGTTTTSRHRPMTAASHRSVASNANYTNRQGTNRERDNMQQQQQQQQQQPHGLVHDEKHVDVDSEYEWRGDIDAHMTPQLKSRPWMIDSLAFQALEPSSATHSSPNPLLISSPDRHAPARTSSPQRTNSSSSSSLFAERNPVVHLKQSLNTISKSTLHDTSSSPARTTSPSRDRVHSPARHAPGAASATDAPGPMYTAHDATIAATHSSSSLASRLVQASQIPNTNSALPLLKRIVSHEQLTTFKPAGKAHEMIARPPTSTDERLQREHEEALKKREKAEPANIHSESDEKEQFPPYFYPLSHSPSFSSLSTDLSRLNHISGQSVVISPKHANSMRKQQLMSLAHSPTLPPSASIQLSIKSDIPINQLEHRFSVTKPMQKLSKLEQAVEPPKSIETASLDINPQPEASLSVPPVQAQVEPESQPVVTSSPPIDATSHASPLHTPPPISSPEQVLNSSLPSLSTSQQASPAPAARPLTASSSPAAVNVSQSRAASAAAKSSKQPRASPARVSQELSEWATAQDNTEGDTSHLLNAMLDQDWSLAPSVPLTSSSSTAINNNSHATSGAVLPAPQYIINALQGSNKKLRTKHSQKSSSSKTKVSKKLINTTATATAAASQQLDAYSPSHVSTNSASLQPPTILTDSATYMSFSRPAPKIALLSSKPPAAVTHSQEAQS